jgi:hypothetical protein
MLSFYNESKLLNPFKTGFRPGHSTTIALLKITDYIYSDLGRDPFFFVLLDFSKAFDTIN